jgi:hypothetical protein
MVEIVSPRLKRLFSDWEDRRRGRDFPARADFDPLEMKYILGAMNLIDVLYDPLRFRFRVHASNTTQRIRMDMTGKFLDDMPDQVLKQVIGEHFTEVIERRAPVLKRRRNLTTDKRFVNNEVLVMPLSNDGQSINMLMAALAWDTE